VIGYVCTIAYENQARRCPLLEDNNRDVLQQTKGLRAYRQLR